jgi:O-glycosyl hydrolase
MKNKAFVFKTLILTLVFFCALNTCDMGYKEFVKTFTHAAAPFILTQPANQGIMVGEDTELSVSALMLGDGTLTYQWYQYLTYRAYQDGAGIPIPDATEETYAFTAEREGEFNFYVVVTNTDTSATGQTSASAKSNGVTVTVNDPKNAKYPVITVQPTGASAVWSPTISLSALTVAAKVDPNKDTEDKDVSASDEIRYQWYYSTSLTNTNGVPIPSATSANFVPPIAIPGQEEIEEYQINGAGNYYYFCVVTNYFFAATTTGRRESMVASNPVAVSISINPSASAPVFAKQPQSAIYLPGDTIVPLVADVNEPEDGGDLSYQWYISITTPPANSNGIPLSGATGRSYSLPFSSESPGKYYYYVVVTNNNPYVANPISTVISSLADVVITTPHSGAGNATFTVQFGGTNQYQYVRGFGGMDVTWGNFPDYSVQDYENMFNPDILGYNMVRTMILPTYTDINRTMEELIKNQIYTTMDRTRYYENVKTVNRYGGYVLASPWSPPAAWKTNNSINGGGDLRASDYQNYARYLRAYCQNMLNNGAPIYAVSIQNEPNYPAGYDGCEWTGEQMRDFFVRVGAYTNGVAGYGGGKPIPSVKRMNGESANTTTINLPIFGNGTTREVVDLLGRHNYGSRNENGAGTGNTPAHNWIYRPTFPKEIWMTEHNLNSNSGTSYPNDHTWNYIWLFMNDVDMTVRINHENAFIWWSAKRFYSMIGDGTYGSRDGEILPRGWGLAHYSKFAKESYRVGVSYAGTTGSGATLAEGGNINGSHYADFESQTVKVSAFMKLKPGVDDRFGEARGVNWRNQEVDISEVEEITMVMYTPTAQSGSGGVGMGNVRLQMPAGFRIASATAMRSDPEIFDSGRTNRGTPRWETVDITADRTAAVVRLPISTILSVRFTQQ